MGGVPPSIPEQQKPVLVVEDSENDALLIQRQLRINGVTNPIIVVNSGDQAILYLSGSGKYANRLNYPMPFVMLLDMKLPGTTDGLAVLRWAPKLQRVLAKMWVVFVEGIPVAWRRFSAIETLMRHSH